MSKVSQPGNAPFAFSLAQIEAVLAQAHRIASHRRPAFQARLKNILRTGLPGYSPGGRGRVRSYGAGELFLFALAMEMAQLGLSPRSISEILRTKKPAIQVLSYRVAQGFEYTLGDIFLTFDPCALSDLAEDDLAAADSLLSLSATEISGGDGHALLAGKSRLSVINVTELYAGIAPIIAQHGGDRYQFHKDFVSWAGTAFDDFMSDTGLSDAIEALGAIDAFDQKA